MTFKFTDVDKRKVRVLVISTESGGARIGVSFHRAVRSPSDAAWPRSILHSTFDLTKLEKEALIAALGGTLVQEEATA